MKQFFLSLLSLFAVNVAYSSVDLPNNIDSPITTKVVGVSEGVTIDPFKDVYDDGRLVIYGIRIVNNTDYHVVVQITYYDNDGKHVRTFHSDTWGRSNAYEFRTDGPARIDYDKEKTWWDYM
jgi:hypothetical protein